MFDVEGDLRDFVERRLVGVAIMIKRPHQLRVHIDLNPTILGPDPPEADAFYIAVGRVVFQWGRFENQFDWILRGIARLPESAAIRPKHKELIPRAFSQKAKFWRKAFQSIDELRPVCPEALHLLADAAQAFDIRSSLVHGHFGPFELGPPFAVHGHNVTHKGDQTLFRPMRITLAGAIELAQFIESLRYRIMPIFKHVQRLQPSPSANDKL